MTTDADRTGVETTPYRDGGRSVGPPGRRRHDVAHAVGNVLSCRTAERAGHRWDGTQRGKTLWCEGWHDVHLRVVVGPELSIIPDPTGTGRVGMSDRAGWGKIGG